jgi:hypothetical protein
VFIVWARTRLEAIVVVETSVELRLEVFWIEE